MDGGRETVVNAFLIINNAHLSFRLEKTGNFFVCLGSLILAFLLGVSWEIMTDLKSAKASKPGSRPIYKYMDYCCSPGFINSENHPENHLAISSQFLYSFQPSQCLPG